MSPRNFSAAERNTIRRRLLTVAAEHFARYGYRRANVADIARDVGIGKGTLYLFFPSKAELFTGTLLEVEAEIRVRLLEEMRRPYPSARDRLRRFFALQREAFAEQPLLAVMAEPEEARALMRDLPAERMEELRVSDERFFAALAEEWRREGKIAPVPPEVLGGLQRALFAMTLQREMIGEEVFLAVSELVIDSLARALTPRAESDD